MAMTDRAYKYLPGITNMQIQIKADHGWATLKAYAEAGYPGAVNGDTGHVIGHTYDDWTTTPKVRRPCLVAVCNRLASTRGLCWKHYNNLRLHEIAKEQGAWPELNAAVRIAREKAR